MTLLESNRHILNEITDTISLHSPDGQEIAITTKNVNGERLVSLYVDDGINISMIEIPRLLFDQLVFHIKPLQ